MTMIARRNVKKSPNEHLTEMERASVMRSGSSAWRLRSVFLLSIILLLAAITGVSCRRCLNTATTLDLTRPIQSGLSRGESQTYLINGIKGQYLRLRIDQQRTDTVVLLRQPDGKELIKINGIENNPSVFSLIADETGNYQLQISSAETGDVSGVYEIKVEEARPATAIDRKFIAAERDFIAGEGLSAQPNAHFKREGIKKYGAAQSQWLEINRDRNAAIASNKKGLIRHQISEPHNALECYNLALSLIESSGASGDPGLRSEILANISSVYIDLGQSKKALETASQAIQLSKDSGDLRREALALYSLGDVEYGVGNRWKSLEHHRAALSIWEKLSDRRGKAKALYYLGDLHRDLDASQKCAEYYDRAFSIYSSIDDRRERARVVTGIAGLELILGNNQKALDLYGQALPLLQTAGDRIKEANAILNTGAVYFRLGDNDKALSHFERARQIWRDVSNPANEAGALSLIGWIHYLKGEHSVALTHFKQVLSVTKSIDDKKFQSNAYRKMGSVYGALGDRKNALLYYKKALSFHQAAGERFGEASALAEIGELYHGLNRNREALRYYRHALEVNRLIDDPLAESQTLFRLAVVERDIGQLAKSRLHIEAASAIAENLRAGVASSNLRATYFASIRQFFEFHIDLLMLQSNRAPSEGADADALKISEAARSRSLLELLTESRANIRRGADIKLVEREGELRKQIENQVKRKTALIEAKAPESELANISKAIGSLIDERERIETQIRSQSPLYASLTRTQTAGLKEIQALLDDDTMLLEYSLGSERSYLWAATSTSLKSHQLPSRTKIEKIAVDLYKTLSKSSAGKTPERLEDEYRRKSSELSRMLLGSLFNQPLKKRLLIVADGVLQYIPFSALPALGGGRAGVRESGGNPRSFVPLMVEHEIVNLPSASMLAILRHEKVQRPDPSKIVAVFADPVFQETDMRLIGKSQPPDGRPAAAVTFLSNQRSTSIIPDANQTRIGRDYRRLHWTEMEAKAIIEVTDPKQCRVWKGFDANRANAISPELSKYRIIHFATHGDLDTDHPELSAIVLSFFNNEGQKQEAYLRLHDIYNLNLPADLVVLSACETALGKEIKGEGLIGLTRGFMYAGSARVMASLWKVEDRSTAELMKYFYKNLLQRGMSPAAALRQAQIDVWKQPEWRLPYHWAGFVLQGEYR